MKPQKQKGNPPPIGPGAPPPGGGPVNAVTCPTCGAELKDGKCPNGHPQGPRGDDGPRK